MKRFAVILMIIFGVIQFAPPAFAVDFTPSLDSAGEAIYGSSSGEMSLEATLARYVGVVLGLLSIFAFLIVVYAGVLWMTAGGKSDQIEKSKSLLRDGAIGLVIILSAYVVSNLVLSNLQKDVYDDVLDVVDGIEDSPEYAP
jgi:hypothetical protein